MKNKPSQSIVYYPFLLAIYPVVALLSVNTGQVNVVDGLRIAAISIIISVLVFFISAFILKNWTKAGLLTVIFLMVFYSYGHIYSLINNIIPASDIYTRHHILLSGYVICLLALILVTLKITTHGYRFTNMLNIISVILVMLPVLKLGAYAIQTSQNTTEVQGQLLHEVAKPDVYYIVLDGYNRADTLQDLYKYNNQPFMNSLASMGFVIPDCTQSNYAWTGLSMASTFQMNYFDKSIRSGLKDDSNLPWAVLERQIKNNPVKTLFKELDYQIVSFGTGYTFTEWEDADFFYLMQQDTKYRGITIFEAVFIQQTTIIRAFTEGKSGGLDVLGDAEGVPNTIKYKEIMFTLDKLQETITLPSPKFVYVHLIAPHAGYTFDSEGNYLVQDRIPGYTDEITYLNARMLDLFESIIKNSKTPPIIILQSDHGWDWERRMAILNALYLPDALAKQVTPDWTPVNTFRLIFSGQFGLDYPLLENVSFFHPKTRQWTLVLLNQHA